MTRHTAMAEALRLTRAGKVLEASAMLRSAFSPVSAAKPIVDPKPERTVDMPMRAAPNAGDRFEERSYHGAEGVMPFRLYRPAQVTDGLPLVVMLHGCTQSPEDFARGTGMNALADERGFLVAYPRQSQRANAQKCWNWFNPADQRRDHGEPALLAGVTRMVQAEYGVPAGKTFVAGLSAGGAAAAIMAAEYPDLFAAVGIHSGLACGAARDLPSALAAMKRGAGSARRTAFVPVITFHGDRDGTVAEINSREIVAAASAAAGVPLQVRTEHGRSASGRAYTRQSSVNAAGAVLIEQWTIEGSGHAWAGGSADGTYTDPSGPDASREMLRFFLDERRHT